MLTVLTAESRRDKNGRKRVVKEMLTGSLSHFSRRHRPLSQVVRVLISLLIRSHYVYYLRAWHRLSCPTNVRLLLSGHLDTCSTWPFLAWGDFHVRSRFALSTIPEEKWGTTRSLAHLALDISFVVSIPYCNNNVVVCNRAG